MFKNSMNFVAVFMFMPWVNTRLQPKVDHAIHFFRRAFLAMHNLIGDGEGTSSWIMEQIFLSYLSERATTAYGISEFSCM
jgi:hypothetical protein